MNITCARDDGGMASAVGVCNDNSNKINDRDDNNDGRVIVTKVEEEVQRDSSATPSLPESSGVIINPRITIDKDRFIIGQYLNDNLAGHDPEPLFVSDGSKAWTILVRGPVVIPTVEVKGSVLTMRFESNITSVMSTTSDATGQKNVKFVVDEADEFETATTFEQLRGMRHLSCAAVSYSLFEEIRKQFFTRETMQFGQKCLQIAVTSDAASYPESVAYIDPKYSRKERNKIMHALNGNIEYVLSGDNITSYNVATASTSTVNLHNFTADGLYFVQLDMVNNASPTQRCTLSTTGTTVQSLGISTIGFYNDVLRSTPFYTTDGSTLVLNFTSSSAYTLNGTVKVVSIKHYDEAAEFKARMHNRMMHSLNGNTTLEQLSNVTTVDIDLDFLTGAVPVLTELQPWVDQYQKSESFEPKEVVVKKRMISITKEATLDDGTKTLIPVDWQNIANVHHISNVNEEVEVVITKTMGDDGVISTYEPSNLQMVMNENGEEQHIQAILQAEDPFRNEPDVPSTDTDDFVGGDIYSSDDPMQSSHGGGHHDREGCGQCEEEQEQVGSEVIMGVVSIPDDIYDRSCQDLSIRAFLAPNYYRWLEVDIYVAKDSVLQKHTVLENLPQSIPLGDTPEQSFDQKPKPRGKIVRALNNKKDNWAHVVRRWRNFSLDKFETKFISALKYNIMYAKLGKHDNFYKAVLEANELLQDSPELKDRMTRCSKARSLGDLAQILGIVDEPNVQSFKLSDSFFSAHIKDRQVEIVKKYNTVSTYWQECISDGLESFEVEHTYPLKFSDLPLKGGCDGWDLYLKNSANQRAHSLFGNIDVDVTEYNPESVPSIRSVIDKTKSFIVGIPESKLKEFITKSYPQISSYAYFRGLIATSEIRASDTNAVPWWRNGNGQQCVPTYFNDNTAGSGVTGSSNPRLYCLLTRRFPRTSGSLLLANINESWTPLLEANGGPVRNYALLNPVLGLPLSIGLVYTSVVKQPLPCSLENWFYRSLYYLQQCLFREQYSAGSWTYPFSTCLGYPVEQGVNATWEGVLAYKNVNAGNLGGAGDPYYGAVKTIKLYTCDPTQLGVTNFWVFPSNLYEKFGFQGLVMFLCMIHDFPLYSMGVDGVTATASHTANPASLLPQNYTLLSSLGLQTRAAPIINVLLPTDNATIPANAAAAVASSRVAVPNAYAGAYYSTATPGGYDATAMLFDQLNLVTADHWTAWIDYLSDIYGAGQDLQSALYMFSQIACRPILDQSKHEDHCNTPWLDPHWDNNTTVSAHKFNNGRIITGSRHHLHNSGNIESSASAFKPIWLLDVPVMSWNALAVRMAIRSVARDGELSQFPRTVYDLYSYLDYASMSQRVAYWTFYKIIGTSAIAWATNNYDLEPALYDPTPKMTNYQKLLLKAHQVALDWIPPQSIDGVNCLYRYHLDTYHTSENNNVTAYVPGSGLQANWTMQPNDCGVKMSIRYSEMVSVMNKFFLLNALPQRQFTLPKMKWVIDRQDYPGQQDVTGILNGLFAFSIPVTLKSYNSATFPQTNNEYFQELMTYNSAIAAKGNAAANWGLARNIQLAVNSQVYLPAPFQWALNGWNGQAIHCGTGVDYAEYSMKEIINIAFYVNYAGILTLIVPQLTLPAYLQYKNGVTENRAFWYINGAATDGMGYTLMPQEDQLYGLLEMEEPTAAMLNDKDKAAPSIQAKPEDAMLNPGDEALKG